MKPTQGSLSAGRLTRSRVFANRYEILELIGEGGMGEVYKARDRDLDEIVALKTIRAERGDDPQVLHRFEQELLLARRVTHENVVRIIDVGEAEGIPYYTMQHIDGVTLKEAIRERGRIPVSEAILLTRGILAALEEAHHQRVIHRDLKPQNIMLDRAGSPHVMDFGVARVLDESGITRTGVILGTPDYMSPEQAQGEAADASSDLFALGIILYEMLTGELPYQGESALSRVAVRLTTRPKPLRRIRSDVPRYLERIVLKCLETDRLLRYQSAREVLQDLDRQGIEEARLLRIRLALARRRRMLAFAATPVLAALALQFILGRSGTENVPPEPEPVEVVALLPLTNTSGADELEWMRMGLPELLFTDLAQSSYVRPVPYERIVRVLQELGIQENRRFEGAELESIARKTGAESLLHGEFAQSDGAIRLSLTLRKAESGVPTPISVESSDVFGLVDETTSRVKEALNLTEEQLAADVDRPLSVVTTRSHEALQSYQLGLSELRRGDSQAAIPALQLTVEKDPQFAMAFARLAEAHLSRGERQAAEEAIDKANALAERVPLPLAERYYVHAVAARADGDVESVAKTYEQLAQLYPEDPDIAFNRAHALEEQGLVRETLGAYQRVVELEPSYGAAVLGLGRAHVMADEHRRAIATIQSGRERGLFEGNSDAMGMAHSILGVAHRELGDWNEALEHFRASLEHRRDSGDHRGEAVTLWNLASIYKSRGDSKRALDLQSSALAIAREAGDREQESNALHEMGLTYLNLGDLDHALDAFEQSMLIETERQDYANIVTSLNLMAEIYRRQSRYADALVYLDNARNYLERSDDRREMASNFHITGMVRREQGRYEEAFEALLQALSIYREIGQRHGMAETLPSLAAIYMQRGRYGEALEALREGIQIMEQLGLGHMSEANALLGRLWLAVSHLDRAESAFSEAGGASHGAHGEEVTAEVLLGQAELARLRGRTEEARDGYLRARAEARQVGRTDLALEASILLTRLQMEHGEIADSEDLLSSAWAEFGEDRLRGLQAEVLYLQAQIAFETREQDEAEASVREAIQLAESFSGHPLLYRAYTLLGDVLSARGGNPEGALDAYANSASSLEYIRVALRPEDVEAFMNRADVQHALRSSVEALESGGRMEAAAPLKKWLTGSPEVESPEVESS